LLARFDLRDRPEAASPDQPRPAARDDERQLASQPLERREVEVVEVEVREQHGVDAAHGPQVELRGPAQVHDPLSQQRVGEELDAVHVHEHGRVPDVRDLRAPAGHAQRSYASRSGKL